MHTYLLDLKKKFEYHWLFKITFVHFFGSSEKNDKSNIFSFMTYFRNWTTYLEHLYAF